MAKTPQGKVSSGKTTQKTTTQKSAIPAPAAGTSRKLVLFSDGTGNSSASLFKTNVWRMYQALDLARSDQLAFYDDGVGTSSFRPLALLGGVFGMGLARNAKDIYAFVCRHYKPGDRIYGFGFSRGAFTMRVVSGIIATQGIITDYTDERDLQRKVAHAYRDYRRSYTLRSFTFFMIDGLRNLRDWWLRIYDRAFGDIPYRGPLATGQTISDCGNTPADIQFLGLWDTVDAYGLPTDEMTRAWDDYLWPLTMRDRKLRPIVQRARHALAVDDERNTFHPVMWEEDGSQAHQPPDERKLLQVWFSGVHSNVGGGYPIDGLSHVSLDWMIRQIDVTLHPTFGLHFIPTCVQEYARTADPLGHMYDSRQGLGAYYRYQPRRFALLDRDPNPAFKALVDAAPQVLRQMPETLRKLPQAATSLGGQVRDLIARRTLGPARTPPAQTGSAPPSPRQNGHGVATGQPSGLSHELVHPIFHHSVFDRIAARTENYAPIIIPDGAQVLDPAGTIISSDAYCAQKGLPVHAVREAGQSMVDNWVWLRRVVFFLTLFTTLAFAAMPFYLRIENTGGTDRTLQSPVSYVPEALSGLLPGFARPWVDAASANPMWFGGFVLALIILNFLGTLLRSIINSRAGLMWQNKAGPDEIGFRPQCLNAPVVWLRTNHGYQWILRWFKGKGAPFLFGCFFLFVFLAIFAQIRFRFGESPIAAGSTLAKIQPNCAMTEGKERVTGSSPVAAKRLFDIRCKYWPSGLELEGGRRYQVTITITRPHEPLPDGDSCKAKLPPPGPPDPYRQGYWWDKNRRADVFGLHPDTSDMSRWVRLRTGTMFGLGVPLRRNIFRPWFSPGVRVGAEGRDEQPLHSKLPPPAELRSPPPKEGTLRNTFVSEFTAHNSGEMFLFVNDAVDTPFMNYYANNCGLAAVAVQALDWDQSYNK